MAISSTTYRITAVLKVETEILARPIIRAMILVTMYLYVKNFKTSVSVFISDVICLTLNSQNVQHHSQFVDNNNITLISKVSHCEIKGNMLKLTITVVITDIFFTSTF